VRAPFATATANRNKSEEIVFSVARARTALLQSSNNRNKQNLLRRRLCGGSSAKKAKCAWPTVSQQQEGRRVSATYEKQLDTTSCEEAFGFASGCERWVERVL